MTREQEAHLKLIKTQFVMDVDTKYRKGAAEHGGNLFDISDIKLVNEAMQEAVDQYVYLYTLRDKIRDTIALYDSENSTSR